MIYKTQEELEENIDARKAIVAVINILVFKGHISKKEGDDILLNAISFAKSKDSDTL